MITKVKPKVKRNMKFNEDLVVQIVFVILIVFMLGSLIVSNLKIAKKRAELAEKVESLQKEIQALEQERTELESGLSEAEKESYWEEKAREQGYVKEGENPVVVLPPVETTNEEEIENQSFSLRIFDTIKNFFARVIQW